MAWTYTVATLASAIEAEAPFQRGDLEFSGVSTDTRKIEPGQAFFALSGERFDGADFVPEAFRKGAAVAVTTRTSDAGPCIVVPDPLKALQQFAAWHRNRFQIPVIAITGSCGKTSSKDFTAAVLGARYRVVKTQGNLNNDIGCPLSLLQIDRGTEAAVIEMGANHLGEIARLCEIARPTESAITMVGPSHLEGFGSIANVATAKGEIVRALPPGGTYYVNVDDNWCIRIAEEFEGKKVRFGTRGDVRLESCEMTTDGEMHLRVHPVGDLRLPLPCRAHAQNVLLAIAIGLEHGVGLRHGVAESPRYFEEPLRAACASASRFRLVQADGLTIIDDTYNANPASMAAALQTLAERPGAKRIAALGDMLELGAAATDLHREIGRLAGELGIDCLFVRGDHAAAMVEAATQSGLPRAEVIQDHQDIARAIREAALPGAAILVKGSRGMRMEKVIEALQNKEQ